MNSVPDNRPEDEKGLRSDIAVVWRQLARALAEQESGNPGAETRRALECDPREELAVACMFIKWSASRAPFDLGAMMADFDDFVASQSSASEAA
jgi:hypothetical protein